jgi:hypothetical protein
VTTPISAASLGQYVLEASNSTLLKQALQNLQNSLGSGDLNGAQSAFQTPANALPKLGDGRWKHVVEQFSTLYRSDGN